MNEWTSWHDKHACRIELIAGIDCWVWTGAAVNGYGRVRYSGRAEYAHRAAFIESGGLFDDGNVVRHMCGNGSCVRPGHLKAGTHKDNAIDTSNMMQGSSKLNHDSVAGIRLDYANGITIEKIADKYGIAYGSVFPIVCGKSFGHVHKDLIVPKGARSPRKLDEAKVKEIRNLLESGQSQTKIARMFGVRQNTISRIKTGVRWRAEHGADHEFLPVVVDMLAGQFNSPWRRK